MVGLLLLFIVVTLSAVSLLFVIKAFKSNNTKTKILCAVLAIAPFSEILLHKATWLYVVNAHDEVTEDYVLGLIESKQATARYEKIYMPAAGHLSGCAEPSFAQCRNEYSKILERGVAYYIVVQIVRRPEGFNREIYEALQLSKLVEYLEVSALRLCGQFDDNCYYDKDYNLSISVYRGDAENLKGDFVHCEKGALNTYGYVVCDGINYFEKSKGFVGYRRVAGMSYPHTFGFLNDLDDSDIKDAEKIASLNWLTGETLNLNSEKMHQLLLKADREK